MVKGAFYECTLKSSPISFITLDYSFIERHRIDKKHHNQYQRYLAFGLKATLEPSRIPATTVFYPKGKLKFKVPKHLGLVAFKKGDLKSACSKVVEAAKALGVKTIWEAMVKEP